MMYMTNLKIVYYFTCVSVFQSHLHQGRPSPDPAKGNADVKKITELLGENL